MGQRKRNPGAIRDLEFWINNGNPSFESLTVSGGITMAGTQIRHPVQFGPYTLTSSSVSLVTDVATWANNIDLSIINVSTNGSSNPILLLGTLTGLVTAGYIGGTTKIFDGSTASSESYSNGFKLSVGHTSAIIMHGHIFLSRHGTATSNTWAFSINAGRSDFAGSMFGGGHIVLPGVLTGMAMRTATGTVIFDNGEVAGFYRY